MEPTAHELEELIVRIERHQSDLGLSDTRFSARFARFVGSHKTYVDRLRARDFKSFGRSLGKWTNKLREFVQEIDGVSREIEIFETLPIVKHAAWLFDQIRERRDDRRCGMIIGCQGTGKTLALRRVQSDNVAACHFFSANETWKDSRMCIARAFATGLGSPISASASETFARVLSRLKEHPTTFLIDEAHEGGVLLMKLIKTIINETTSRVILAQYPTSWRRLNNAANDAYAEAQQLLRRTLRPVRMDWIGGIQDADAAAWCRAAGVEGWPSISKELLPLIRENGNYSLMADALARAHLLADETEEDVTARLFRAQVREVCGLPRETPQQTETKGAA